MRPLIVGLSLMIAASATGVAAAEKPVVAQVWPGQPPGENGSIGEERDMTRDADNKVGGRRLIRLGNVSTPTLHVFRPERSKDTGAAVVIAPGGGYHILAWDLEGEEVAEWLADIGVTGVVLKYRVPRRPGQAGDKPPVGPLQDAQRSISFVRSKAKEWNLDPNRIGVLGFSAGGHLAASASVNYDRRAYEPIDEIDKVSCKPDFSILIYPAYLVNAGGTALLPEIRVDKNTPPAFLAHASDDPINPLNSVQYYAALKQAGVPAELHVYRSGGHGYGLRSTEEPVTSWPARCAEWMKKQGLLKK